ncbi:TIGR04222 domain-containing membrane protein [Kitasatospora sp. NPDC004615]|uniref:TIGR04222 domain-containing membrane protein n=1 Tax=Kitasatospora sp. NPDC004615 TaxID=3364017 RepID=UPI00368CF03A
MVWQIGVVCAVTGLVGAGLLRWLPVRGRVDGLTAVEVAGVRGGSKAALGVAVVELHLAGAIDAGSRGRLRRVVHTGPGRDVTVLHRAVWTAFGRDLSFADAAAAPAVRRARDELGAELAGRGLRCGRARLMVARLLGLAAGGAAVGLATGGAAVGIAAQGARWAGVILAVLAVAVLCAPARTLAGCRLLRELRCLHPLPGGAPAGTEEVGLLVALHGRRALRSLVPTFAAGAGLLGGGAARETVARSEGGPYEGWGVDAGDSGGS